MHQLLLYWGGDARGMAFEGPRQDFPISVPVASHAPHAVGVAYAMKYRREPRVALCVLGDGATSKGDFYEALNGAGVWQLPLVFVVNNNQWAISVPRAAQSRAATLAQKAIAAGIEGEQVDGNDVIAVRERVGLAVERARAGGGPGLIEAVTYRLCDHTTADDAARYRAPEELEAHWRQEPIARLRRHLLRIRALTEEADQRLHTECASEVEEQVSRYLATAPLAPQSLFEHLYATLPTALEAQCDRLRAEDPAHD
jgi:pyruvate dehydrogenase E1 component alpha subunit